mgnify:FL=1
MRKLLLVVFSILAINAQGQSLTEEPIVITAKSEIAHFFVANPFLYTITESSKDYIVDIYNDELKKSDQFIVKNAVYDREADVAYGIADFDLDELTGYDAYSGSIWSQYLFNDDDKIEYIFCTFNKEKTGNQSTYSLQKAEVMNEDGAVLGTLPVEAINSYFGYGSAEITIELVQFGKN